MSLCFRALTKQNHIVVLRELLVHMTCDIILKRTNNYFLCIGEGNIFVRTLMFPVPWGRRKHNFCEIDPKHNSCYYP